MLPSAVFKRGPIRVGRYELMEGIGNGWLGTVYRANDTDTGMTVSVQLIRPEVAADTDRLGDMFDTFRAATHLDHPNLVRAIEAGTDGSLSYLVTEYVDGTTLGKLLSRTGRLPEVVAVRIMTHVAQGLDYAHRQQVTHLAVSPDIVYVRADGFAKLAGFGMPRDAAGEMAQAARPFAAPELAGDPGPTATRADVYSLAATLFAAVTGVPPTATGSRRVAPGTVPSPRDLVPSLSDQLDRVVRRGISPAPTRRPASCLAFVKLLPAPTAPEAASGRRPGLSATPMPRPADERRGALRRVCAVSTTCVIDTDLFGGGTATEEAWPATVRDISRTGVGLVLARRFEPGTLLAVEVGGGANGATRSLLARVVRVLPEDVGHWFHGCAFDDSISPTDIASLS